MATLIAGERGPTNGLNWLNPGDFGSGGFDIGFIWYVLWQEQPTSTYARGDLSSPLINLPNVVYEFFGTGFTYDNNNVPTGGTLNKIIAYDNGLKVFELNGFALPMAQFVSLVTQAAQPGDNNAANNTFKSTVLAGADSLIGSSGPDILPGWGGDDEIRGNGGDDHLIGGLGADAMYGGAGNDTYWVDSASDTVNEAPGEGVDTVWATVSYSLPANVENLELTGTANIDGTGNALDNVLTGNSGTNVLTGGLGNDTYVIQTPADQVVESAGEGTDTVVAPFSYTLGANFEHLTLSGTASVNGTGNGASNILTGNGGRNTLDGGADNDSLFGRGGNDTLIAGTGNDFLDGGYGTDTAVLEFSRASAAVARFNGDVVITTAGSTDVLHGVERAQFTDQSLLLASDAHASGVDFSGDGKADILWRATSDAVALWTLSGTAVAGAVIGNAGQYWTLAASGDFDGDSKADILWRGAGDEVALWTMKGSQPLGAVIQTVTPYWSIAGSGDFNSDGKADILWRGEGGEVALWTMNGFQPTGKAVVGTPSLYWSVAGIGDFNGDRTDDILWRGEGGEVALWTMNAGQTTSDSRVGTAPTDWTIADTADFNGDGKADILWRGPGGQVALWTMSGDQPIGQAVIQTVPPSWSIVGSGDFNGDGKADILWRSDGGTPALWTMDGFQPTSQSALSSTPSYDWLIA